MQCVEMVGTSGVYPQNGQTSWAAQDRNRRCSDQQTACSGQRKLDSMHRRERNKGKNHNQQPRHDSITEEEPTRQHSKHFETYRRGDLYAARCFWCSRYMVRVSKEAVDDGDDVVANQLQQMCESLQRTRIYEQDAKCCGLRMPSFRKGGGWSFQLTMDTECIVFCVHSLLAAACEVVEIRLYRPSKRRLWGDVNTGGRSNATKVDLINIHLHLQAS